jgi:hypothetical protein
MMLVFQKAPAVEKFKMLLSANKETYRYIMRNAAWATYIRDEFHVPDGDIQFDRNHAIFNYSLPNGINFKWLYWAVAAYTSQRSNGTRTYLMYDKTASEFRNALPQNNGGFKVIISETDGAELSVHVKVLDTALNRRIMQKLDDTVDITLAGSMPVTDLGVKHVEVFRPQGHLKVHSYRVEPIYRLSEVWILYMFLSAGYSVRLDDPETYARDNYYVRSDIVCAQCFMPADQMCGKCMATRYCSVECQQKHWDNGHSDICG